jgi:hypothetical protein
MVKNIIFIKTHKCASTTLQSYLLEYAKINNLHILSPFRKEMNDAFYVQQPLSYRFHIFRKKPFNININHSPYEPYLKKIIPNAICIASVRDPLTRAISQFYSFNHNSAGIPYKKLFDMDFNQYYRDYYNNMGLSRDSIKLGIDNYVSKWLGFYSEDEIDREALINRYYFIGLKENMKKTVEILRTIIDIQYDVPGELKNTSEFYNRFQVSNEVRELFQSNNQMDYKLYRICQNIFEDYRFEDFRV